MAVMFLAYAFDADRRELCLRSTTPLIAGAPIVWAHVAHEGVWKGHPKGPFELTRAHFERAVANHAARETPPKVDFDHETDFRPPGTALPARGWVQQLEVRDGEDGRAELWAEIELGAKAVEAHADGGYRFNSAVFSFDAVDRVTGEPIGFSLMRLALTDDPFIDGQQPIQLSAQGDTTMKKIRTLGAATDKVGELAALLGVTLDDAMEDPWKHLFDRIHALQAAATVETITEGGGAAAVELSGGAGEGEETEEETEETMELAGETDTGTDPAAQIAQLLEAAGVTTFDELLAKVTSASSEGAAAEAVLSARHQASALERRLSAAEAQLLSYRTEEANRSVEQLVQSGRLLDTGRAFARSLFLSDRKGFEAFTKGLPLAVPVGSHATGHEPPTETTPAIDEADPEVKEMRVWLSNAGIDKADADKIVLKRLSERGADGTTTA